MLKINLRTYNKILKRSIKLAKTDYYQFSLTKYKNDIQGTWRIIKDILNKTQKKKTYPEHLLVDGKLIADKCIITDKFNLYFLQAGPNLASQIVAPENKSFKDYLISPCENKFEFTNVTVECTSNVINNLKTKTSCEEDGLSVKLLKLINNDICSSITLIINQSFMSGIFPE